LKAHRALLTRFYGLAITQRGPSVRLILLFASVLKVERMGRAAQLLAGEGFAEEIRALNRTLAEVTINAAYLQNAEDEEVDRFQHFDTQSVFRHANRLRPHATAKSSPEEQKKIQAVADHARTLTGRKDNDPSWSKRTLLQRAEFSDGITQLDLMVKLTLTSYAYGHCAIHGTYDALDFFTAAVINDGTKAPLLEERQEMLSLALFSVNFTLSVMCLYLNSFFRLGAEREIVDVDRMTN
jgi:hypothetical protein